MDSNFIANWMRLKQLGCDGIIKTEDGAVFHVHFVLLCQVSGFFRAWYANQWNKTDSGPMEVHIQNISGDTMGKVVQFVYCHSVDARDQQMAELLVAADYLQIDSLVAHCSDNLIKTLCDENCIPFFKTALMLEHLKLFPIVRRYFLLHFEDIVLRDINSTNDFTHQVLLNLLKDDSLNATEEIVWKVIHHWLDHDVIDRSKYLPSLLGCLRLSRLDEDFVFNNIYRNPSVLAELPIPVPVCGNTATGCRRTIMEALQKLVNEPLFFGSRAPKEIAFLVRDSEMRSTEKSGCWIYEIYDYEFDTFRLVSEESSSRLPSIPCGLCSVGRKICIQPIETGNRVIAFDVINRTWDWLPPFDNASFEPYIVSLEGKLYALGASDDEAEQELLVYDEDEQDWISLETMNTRHEGLPVAVDDCIYVFGGIVTHGEEEYLEEIERYDPEYDLWAYISRPNVPRSEWTVGVYRNELYTIGGRISDGSYTTVVEKYDSKNDLWERLRDIPYILQEATLLVFDDVLIYSSDFQGEELESEKPALFLDVSDGNWKPITLLNRPWVSMLEKCVNFHPHQVCTINDPDVIRELRKQKWAIPSGSRVLYDVLDDITNGSYDDVFHNLT